MSYTRTHTLTFPVSTATVVQNPYKYGSEQYPRGAFSNYPNRGTTYATEGYYNAGYKSRDTPYIIVDYRGEQEPFVEESLYSTSKGPIWSFGRALLNYNIIPFWFFNQPDYYQTIGHFIQHPYLAYGDNNYTGARNHTVYNIRCMLGDVRHFESAFQLRSYHEGIFLLQQTTNGSGSGIWALSSPDVGLPRPGDGHMQLKSLFESDDLLYTEIDEDGTRLYQFDVYVSESETEITNQSKKGVINLLRHKDNGYYTFCSSNQPVADKMFNVLSFSGDGILQHGTEYETVRPYVDPHGLSGSFCIMTNEATDSDTATLNRARLDTFLASQPYLREVIIDPKLIGKYIHITYTPNKIPVYQAGMNTMPIRLD